MLESYCCGRVEIEWGKQVIKVTERSRIQKDLK